MSSQLITFQIGEQFLGVDIMAIREIRAWSPTTLLPHVPDYVRGVINLRGNVLPVIDLGARLGWGLTDPTGRHVIIVVRIDDQLHGLIVDAVNDIVTVDDEAIQAPPSLSTDSASAFLKGLVAVEDRMVMILSLDNLAVDTRHMITAEAA
jgi:purine-binding chemotaxis protein CheW